MVLLRSLLVLAALWLATGCEINRVLTLKPDGSGQITEHFLASRDSFQKEKPADPNAAPTLEMAMPRPTKESVGKDGAKLGEGIKLVSFKPIETKDMLGYDAIYEFSDINKIHADAFLQHEGGEGLPGQEKAHDAAKDFKFTKGAVNELVVPMLAVQGPKDANKEQSPPDEADPKQREAFFEGLRHLHLRMSIRVQGTIAETNAHFRDGNEVVLSEINMKGFAADPKHAQEFKDAATGKTHPKDPPTDDRYFKREEAEVLKIRFK